MPAESSKEGTRDMTKQPTAETKGDPGAAGQTKIKWDDSQMRSSYANVCNVSSTREEMVLMFGINQAWNAAQRELTVQLTERVIMSPYAAKRLQAVLSNVVREYETRWGAMDIESPPSGR